MWAQRHLIGIIARTVFSLYLIPENTTRVFVCIYTSIEEKPADRHIYIMLLRHKVWVSQRHVSLVALIHRCALTQLRCLLGRTHTHTHTHTHLRTRWYTNTDTHWYWYTYTLNYRHSHRYMWRRLYIVCVSMYSHLNLLTHHPNTHPPTRVSVLVRSWCSPVHNTAAVSVLVRPSCSPVHNTTAVGVLVRPSCSPAHNAAAVGSFILLLSSVFLFNDYT